MSTSTRRPGHARTGSQSDSISLSPLSSLSLSFPITQVKLTETAVTTAPRVRLYVLCTRRRNLADSDSRGPHKHNSRVSAFAEISRGKDHGAGWG